MGRPSIVLFGATVFTSAFLLFQVQPLIGRYILPWFGGAPGVWTACMLFFQITLLLGYAYADASIRWLRPRTQIVLHVALLAVCAAMVSIAPSAAWKPRATADVANPTWRILALLAIHVGLPFFTLSATGPLLQAWITRLSNGAAPYRFYALSNTGSLLALLSYPVVIEPLLDRSAQAGAWTWGLRGFALLCTACAVLTWRHTRAAIRLARLARTSPPTPLTRWALWFALPAVASTLLLAVTGKICQDIAVVPFLWVLPLSIYLLSFILTFDSDRWYSRGLFSVLLVMALCAATWLQLAADSPPGILFQIALYSLLLLICCMVLHGELVMLRPDPSRLTGFYLMIAAGGAAGGLFVGLLAPILFTDNHELVMGLLACALVIAGAAFASGRPLLQLTTIIALGLALTLAAEPLFGRSNDLLWRGRSFYGTLSVWEHDRQNPAEHRRVLRHGEITHGTQWMHPSRRAQPTTYYQSNTGIGLVLSLFRADSPRHIGGVGLGIGTIAIYGKPGDRIRFYEINPLVERAARDYFTCIADSPAQVSVVLGDARVSLELEPPQQFDILALDAFSGDAVPIHLLTREAFEIYLRHLVPDGVIAVHISNRHLDLMPVVAAAGRDLGLRVGLVLFADKPFESEWALLTRNERFTQLDELRDAFRYPPVSRPAWTDESASLWSVLAGNRQ